MILRVNHRGRLSGNSNKKTYKRGSINVCRSFFLSVVAVLVAIIRILIIFAWWEIFVLVGISLTAVKGMH